MNAVTTVTELTDAQLMTAIQRTPSVLGDTQIGVTAAYHRARRGDWVDVLADMIWAEAKELTRLAATAAEQLRIALDLEAAFGALAGLSSVHRHALRTSIQGEQRLAVFRAAMMAHPATAAWQAKDDARDVKARVIHETVTARQQAAWQAAQPALILAALGEQGITLGLDKSGKDITATNAAGITPEDLAALKTYKPGIVALLADRAAAERAAAAALVPVLVA